MERETRLQLATAIGAVTTIGLGISGILFHNVSDVTVGIAAFNTVSNVGINLLSGLIERVGGEGIKQVGRSPLENHDVEQAMLLSIKKALQRIEELYFEEENKQKSLWDKLWNNDPLLIRVFLAELYQDLNARFFSDANAVFTLPTVQAYLNDVKEQPHPDLLNQLAVNFPFLETRCGERFAALFERELLPQIQHFFTEQLKTNERVRTGFEQFLFQQILREVKETKLLVTETNELVKSTTPYHLSNSNDYQRMEARLAELEADFADCQADIEEMKTTGLTKRLHKAEAELLKIAAERSQLQQEKEAFVVFARELGERVAQLANTPTTQQLNLLIEQGKLREADLLLQPSNLEQGVQELAKLYLVKAQLQTNPATQKENPNWFADADHYYRRALDLWKNYDNLWAYAHFLLTHNKHQIAANYYQQCLALAETDRQRANTLNSLGILHYHQKDYFAALDFYNQALSIYQALAESHPSIHLPDLADIFICLGNLHKQLRHYPIAEQFLKDALAIYRQLAQNKAPAHLSKLAMTLHNLGILQYNQTHLESALQYLNEALNIYRPLAETNPQTYLPNLAITLNNLGNLQLNQMNCPIALQFFEESLAIYQQLAAINPHTYLSFVAITLNNLGNLYANGLKDNAAALRAYEQSMAIERGLAAANPGSLYSGFGDVNHQSKPFPFLSGTQSGAVVGLGAGGIGENTAFCEKSSSAGTRL